ncbi:ferredoxin [Dactylosporangium sp. NPDC000244]|uniref:ferredoxin n=1 Tax=Dactylosporangium sp. NPDC000244 TaxID=3154365 RepID=UPI003318F808
MIRVHVDLGLCQGFANCVMVAPEHIDLDENNKAVAVNDLFPDSDLSDLTEAAESCPAFAIRLERVEQ